MRLIDADALIEAHYDYCCKHHGEADVFYAWSLQLMKNAPTVDAVEVVRCGKCKRWKNGHLCEAWSRYGTIETRADQFCNYGEGE